MTTDRIEIHPAVMMGKRSFAGRASRSNSTTQAERRRDEADLLDAYPRLTRATSRQRWPTRDTSGSRDYPQVA